MHKLKIPTKIPIGLFIKFFGKDSVHNFYLDQETTIWCKETLGYIPVIDLKNSSTKFDARFSEVNNMDLELNFEDDCGLTIFKLKKTNFHVHHDQHDGALIFG